MKKADRANWTIEHEIILPPDQARALRKRLRLLRTLQSRLGEMIAEAAEIVISDQDAEWDRMAVMFGYPDLDAATLADRTMEIDWHTGRLTLYRLSDEAGPPIGKEAEHDRSNDLH